MYSHTVQNRASYFSFSAQLSFPYTLCMCADRRTTYRGATVFPDNIQRGPEPEEVELGLITIAKLIILGHTFYLKKPPSVWPWKDLIMALALWPPRASLTMVNILACCMAPACFFLKPHRKMKRPLSNLSFNNLKLCLLVTEIRQDHVGHCPKIP